MFMSWPKMEKKWKLVAEIRVGLGAFRVSTMLRVVHSKLKMNKLRGLWRLTSPHTCQNSIFKAWNTPFQIRFLTVYSHFSPYCETQNLSIIRWHHSSMNDSEISWYPPTNQFDVKIFTFTTLKRKYWNLSKLLLEFHPNIF